MSKHTPGPWVLENRGYKFIVSKPDDGYITRDVCRMDASTMSAFAQEANARLIAAAPLLYEALKDIAGTDPVDAALDPQRAVRIARAAIARAK